MYNKNMKKKQIIFYFLVILVLGNFLYLYNYLNIHNSSQPLIFNSPDETSNYFFTENFAENNNFQKQFNYLNINPEIHPRSIRVMGDKLVLNSFIGLPLIHGLIAKIFGNNIVIYLTSIFSIIGVIFFYLLIKELFNKKTAIISSLLLLILPSYWYFSTRGMMHNILFIMLLIISLYFFVLSIKKGKTIHYGLSALFLGLTIMTRTSEIIWIGIIYLALIMALRYKINWKKFIIGVIVFLIIITPLFYFNRQNYGSAISPAYIDNKAQIQTTSLISKILLPFGFHPNNIKYTMYNFIFKLIWWYNVLLLLALVLLFIKRKKIKQKQWLYVFLWIFVTIFLFIYYGSWLFFDNPNPKSITIGSSYLRYLLPYFVFSIPLISWFLTKIKFSKKWVNNLIIILIISFVFINSYLIVMKCPEEGIVKISNDLKIYQNRTKLIIANTEPNSVITTSRADKYIFPYRNVLYLEYEPYYYNNFNSILDENIPLYYFGFKFNDKDMNHIFSKFYKKGLDISYPIFIDGDHALYKIMLINRIYAKN